MEREIKFRVWDDNLKVMYSPDNQIGGLWNIKEAWNGIIKYKNGTLMQYIGLKDRTGQDIYEGDICKFPKNDGSESILTIVYNNRMACFEFSKENAPISLSLSYEIIGNIYENPELMEYK